MIKILTIGSGDMWSINNSASYLINNDILLDIPNGTCRELRRKNINPSNINHVLISHLHADHFFDIPFYLFDRSKTKDIKDSVIYCDKEDNEKILELIDISFCNARKYISLGTNIILNNDNNFVIDKLNIERRKVKHGDDINAYGYIISDGSNIVGFTGDTAMCKEIEEMALSCQTLICDCTLINGNNYHMGIDNLIYLSNNFDCYIYATHINDETRKYIENDRFTALTDGKQLILKK